MIVTLVGRNFGYSNLGIIHLLSAMASHFDLTLLINTLEFMHDLFRAHDGAPDKPAHKLQIMGDILHDVSYLVQCSA